MKTDTRWPLLITAAACLPLAACLDSSNSLDTGVTARMDPAGDGFYDFPYPDIRRLDVAAETIDLTGFPNPEDAELVSEVVGLAGWPHTGFSPFAVVSIGFDGPVDTDNLRTMFDLAPEPDPNIFFLNVDVDSARFGERIPAVASFFDRDGRYVEENLLTVAPWPGRSMQAGSTYAAIVLRSVGDPDGNLLGQPRLLTDLLDGIVPDVVDGQDLANGFAPLVAYLLDQDDLVAGQIAAATVFPVDDPVQRMYDIAQGIADDYQAVTAQPLKLVQDEPEYCYFEGTVTMPQFQVGESPFSEPGSGGIEFDEDGKPIKQRDEEIKVVLSIPRNQAMPAAGFPYLEYVHGSGGIASQVMDRGRKETAEGDEEPWRGPGWVAALRGWASGSQAMPVSPDRVPNASSFAYFQITNLEATRGDFWQGTAELLMKWNWLAAQQWDAGLCHGADIPGGAFKVDPDLHVTMGQSMGAMYTNFYGAVAHDTKAVIPTGSGGYWSFFLFTGDLIPGFADLLGSLMNTKSNEPLSHLHPVLGLVQQYLDAIDPMLFTTREIREPLPDVPAKHMLVPLGRQDSYFSIQTQRAISVGYGVPILGDLVDPIAPGHQDPFFEFESTTLPASANLTAGDGQVVTAGIVQFEEDDVQQDGHVIVFQRPEAKYLYACFLESLATDGIPTIVAPDKFDEAAPCP